MSQMTPREIVQELDLVRHGFMPLLMSSTFAPMENGDYLLLGQDHGANQQEIRRHTVLSVLAKPVSRPALLLGKFLGIAVALASIFLK